MRLIFITLFLGASLFSAGYEYVLPQKDLQSRISNEFPIVKETMFLTFHISDPKIALDGVKQRVRATATLQVPNIKDEKGNAAKAVLTLSSQIAYSKGGNLYLRNIKVITIKSKLISDDMVGMLKDPVQEAPNEYFKSRPVYSLQKEKGIIGMAVNSITNVTIVSKGIKVLFGASQ